MIAPSARTRTYRPAGSASRLLVVVLVLWFVIGAIAAGQRGYYSSGSDNCAHAGTIAVTILAGPLNYVGANPKVQNCNVPEPSK
jgi:membrane protein YdbS with pleckstrin-like domain